MSEQAAEAAIEPQPEQIKKKKGKLPLLLALVILLGGGGFFAFKMKGGSGKASEVKLGEIVPLDETLVNLQSPNAYARAQLALHVREGFTKEQIDKALPAIKHEINMVLSSKSLRDVGSTEGKLLLKRELAEAINAVLEPDGPTPAQKPETDAKNSAVVADKSAAAKAAKPKHPDWDSEKGPVLKVYFTSLATQ